MMRSADKTLPPEICRQGQYAPQAGTHNRQDKKLPAELMPMKVKACLALILMCASSLLILTPFNASARAEVHAPKALRFGIVPENNHVDLYRRELLFGPANNR